MLITISGTIGAGKGTTATRLGKKLKLPVYSIGDIRRDLARARRMTLEEFNRYGEAHPETDRDVDRWQGTMAAKTGRGIFEGRVSYHFIPQSLKIYLACSRAEGARRIQRDSHWKRKHEADLSTLASTERAMRRRVASDTKRYRQYYGISIHDRRQYDLVISTTNLTPAEVERKILKFIAEQGILAKNKQIVNKEWKRWQMTHSRSAAYKHTKHSRTLAKIKAK